MRQFIARFSALIIVVLLLTVVFLLPPAVIYWELDARQKFVDAAVEKCRKGIWRAGTSASELYAEPGRRGGRKVKFGDVFEREISEYHFQSAEAYLSIYVIDEKLVAAHYLSDHNTDEWFFGGPTNWKK